MKSLLTACSVALALLGGIAQAAPVPLLEKDPAGFLRYVQSSPSPEAQAARRTVADGPADLARERALAQKEGIAVFPAQLNRPLPPEDRNAAPLYVKLDALRHAKPLKLPRYAQSLTGRYAYTPAQLARVRQEIAARQDVFTLLHHATDRPECVFAHDWTKNTLNPPFMNYAGLRESARELRTESVLLAEEGKYAEAITNQTRGYRLAEHAASDGTLISYLVAVAIDAITTSGMQDILALAGPNADVDAQVEEAVTDKAARLSLRRALSGDVAVADAGFALIRQGGPSALNIFANLTEAAPHPMAATSTPGQRRFFAHLVDAAEADYIRRMRAVVRVADTTGEAAAFAAAVRATAPSGDLVQQFAHLLWPMQYETLNALPVRSAVSNALTRAAASVLLERAKTGAYPEALPAMPTDPYTNKPLGYRREGAGGFVVYSGGPDGKYDGGTPGDQASSAQARFRFRYPAVRVPVPLEEQR